VIDFFRIAISNDRGPQILTMSAHDIQRTNANEEKLMVVLRSFDGNVTGVKVNELMVKSGKAHSTGAHSRADEGDRMGSQESLVSTFTRTSSVESLNTVNPVSNMAQKKVSALIILQELVERHVRSNSDKRTSLINVKVTQMDTPDHFYIQIIKLEVKDYTEAQDTELHNEYSSSRHPLMAGIEYNDKDLCAFKEENEWKRGEVITCLTQLEGNSEPQEPTYSVFAIDYGTKHTVKVSQMRPLTAQFQKDGAYAVKCRLHGLKPTGGDRWSATARDKWQDFLAHEDMYVLIKNDAIESEPIAVKLYFKETVIPGAFKRQRTVYTSLNQILIDNGLAYKCRTKSSANSTVSAESDDDMSINSDVRNERREMPISLFTTTESILECLSKRYKPDTNQIGPEFKYLPEVYPNGSTFFAIATEFVVNNEFHISFREFHENMEVQPNTQIENQIMETLKEKGEFAPFGGPFSKGNACTAYFDYDKTWNRAEIVGVVQGKDSQSRLIIKYVDYGNQESILVDRLSSEVFGRNTPKLAIRCHMINIKPRDDEADKAIRDLIYQKVLDHKCRYFWEVSAH
jgi:hypothetical protein